MGFIDGGCCESRWGLGRWCFGCPMDGWLNDGCQWVAMAASMIMDEWRALGLVAKMGMGCFQWWMMVSGDEESLVISMVVMNLR
ncbi:hypothetical protein V6N13_064250 [Hibiscus sabdariffa]|uniref:Transmembrane protein n=1 Tax=Hibiscus sabdariffa TaxID=183260 RepID=A0ABR2E9E5_9ROSI